jgi:surface antigen
VRLSKVFRRAPTRGTWTTSALISGALVAAIGLVGVPGNALAAPAERAIPAAASTGGYPWASATCQTSPLTYHGVQYCPNDNWVYNSNLYDTWGYAYRNCTSWVAWRLSTNNGYTMPRAIGDARAWGPYFTAHGHAPNNTPAPGAIAWEPDGNHVAYVESVSAGGSQVTISEYNEHYYPGQVNTGDGLYDIRTVPSGDFEYIHVKDLPAASAPPVIGVVTSSGDALAKEGSLSARWTDEYNGATEVAVASDSVNGPLIAVVTSSGEVLVKEGSLSAPWTDEYNGATEVAVASDPVNGPLIAVLTSSGSVLAKEGSLSAAWTDEYNGINEYNGAIQVAVASDPANGPLIAISTDYTTGNAEVLAKQGSLSAAWTDEYDGYANDIAVASDPANGPLIAISIYTGGGEVLAKEGSLSAAWTDEYNGATGVAVASDPTHGPLIAVYANSGEALAKEGSLSAAWTDEYKLLPFLAVASDPAHGPLIAVWSGSGKALAKQGSLSAVWTDEYNGATDVAVAG